MIRHYEGELGNFDYDDEEFEIVNEYKPTSYLHYKGNSLSVNLPKGCINTRHLFEDCKLPDGFSLGDFDTSKVVDMCSMFMDCKLPDGFSLGDKFDTSGVKFMCYMFCGSTIPNTFSLGNKFYLNNIKDMSGMFFNCQLPPGAPNEQNPWRVINWLQSRKTETSIPDHNETEEEHQINVVCKFIEDFYIKREAPLGHEAINQMRICGYDDAVIRQAMIKAIDNLMRGSSEKSSYMNVF